MRSTRSRAQLVYFAFPKCASEKVRAAIGAKYDNVYDPDDWHMSSPAYAHTPPSRAVLAPGDQAFTVVRNTYERLLSAWNYMAQNRMPGFHSLGFREFILKIGSQKDRDLSGMPMRWMYMPFDRYFDGVDTARLQVFDVADLGALRDFLAAAGIDGFDPGRVVNTKPHRHYREYYTPELRAVVDRVYAPEIARFGYAF